MNDNAAIWWVIKGPVLASIMVRFPPSNLLCDALICHDHHVFFLVFFKINFVLFVGIIVILVQKLQSPDIGGNESSIYL